MSRVVNLENMYFCKGENFTRSIPIGFCGETKRLIDFLMICFPGYEEDYVRDYFKDYDEKYVLEYVYVNGGKRLEKV